ncbi:hypothetical protein ACJX0J_025826, partial [Zea mays]
AKKHQLLELIQNTNYTDQEYIPQDMRTLKNKRAILNTTYSFELFLVKMGTYLIVLFAFNNNSEKRNIFLKFDSISIRYSSISNSLAIYYTAAHIESYN